MFSKNDLQRHAGLDDFQKLAARLFVLGHASSVADFLEGAVGHVRELSGAKSAALVRGRRGLWSVRAAAGSEPAYTPELLAEALDRDELIDHGTATAIPLTVDELLVLSGPPLPGRASTMALAAALAAALGAIETREARQHRVERLEAIVQIAAQWQRTQDMNSLLCEIAETSTRLLDAERASIFLWDHATGTLVGRPALGVEGGELRFADDRGIVGHVVQTGEPRRVDADDLDQPLIDRRVDRKLGFQTRSLLCVPLLTSEQQVLGAFEMINKRGGSFSDDDETALVELAAHAAAALEDTRQYQDLLKNRDRLAEQAAEQVQLIGDCPAIEALRGTIARIAKTDLAVLVLGENGTGKEVVSQRIHYLSDRRNEPLIAINCAAMTESLLESELFGHEKGAFTDASETRIGKFELASGGTLFLDEIGELSLGGQAKLLRVLEDKVVVRVGGSAPVSTDTRVIAATNQNLADMVRQKRFREDLYYRLNVVTMELPPLRERGSDIQELADFFLARFCAKAGRRLPQLLAAARKRLREHSWPGNVRELRNLMERLTYLTTEDRIDADQLSFIMAPDGDTSGVMMLDLTLNDATKRFQSHYIKKHIEHAQGNMTDAATRLGLHRSNLYRKMKQLEMGNRD